MSRLRVQAPSAEHYDELYKTRKVYAEACTFLISHLQCTEVAGTSQAAHILQGFLMRERWEVV